MESGPAEASSHLPSGVLDSDVSGSLDDDFCCMVAVPVNLSND